MVEPPRVWVVGCGELVDALCVALAGGAATVTREPAGDSAVALIDDPMLVETARAGNDERVVALVVPHDAPPETLPDDIDDVLLWPLAPSALTARLALYSELAQLRSQRRLRCDQIVELVHDLRVPLFTIDGSARLLADPATGGLADGQCQLVDAIQAAAGEMSAMIEELRDLAHLEAGTLRLTKTIVDVPALVKEVVAARQTALSERRVAVEIAIAGTPRPTKADAGRLRRVIGNVLANAIRHSPPGGTITIQIEYADTLIMRIRDQGPGVAEADRERVFERGVRLGERGGAAGLGLSICRAIVVAHGGRIDIEPGVDGGAFRIELPLT